MEVVRWMLNIFQYFSIGFSKMMLAIKGLVYDYRCAKNTPHFSFMLQSIKIKVGKACVIKKKRRSLYRYSFLREIYIESDRLTKDA